MKTENVIIIGGGPAGLAASIYNARADLKPLVIAGSPPGGQLMLTSDVENYPGIPSIKGAELIGNMRSHSEKFGTRFINEHVKKLDLSSHPFTVTLPSEDRYNTKSIIIATGASAMWLGLESEQRLRGKGVSACANCDGFFMKDKEVAVVGGGDTAMEEALSLTKFAKKVYIIHRRDEFRASKIMQKRALNHKKIEPVWNAEVKEILGTNSVEGLALKESTVLNPKQKLKAEVPDKLEVQGIFIAIGHKPETKFLEETKVALNPGGYIYTSDLYLWEKQKRPNLKVQKSKFDFDYKYQTTVPGVFAAGDVVDYIYRQATTAIGMGVAAALEAERYLSTL